MQATIYIYIYMHLWMCGCLFVCMHTCVYCEMAVSFFFFFFEAFSVRGNRRASVTSWCCHSHFSNHSMSFIVSDLHVSWSVARSAIPRPPHIPPFSLRENNDRADADHLFSPHACVWRQTPPACLWLSRRHSLRLCSSLQGSLVWVWDNNILFVTSSLIRANCLFLTSLHLPFLSISILPETWFAVWMFCRHSLEVLNVLAKDTSELSFW